MKQASLPMEMGRASARLKMNFPTGYASSELDEVFTNMSFRGMLKGEDYQALDTLCQIVAYFTTRVSGLTMKVLISSRVSL